MFIKKFYILVPNHFYHFDYLVNFSVYFIERFNSLLIFLIFFYLLFLFNIISCNTLLPNGKAHAIPAEIGTTIKPTPVTDNVTVVVVVAPIVTTVSTDSNIDLIVL